MVLFEPVEKQLSSPGALKADVEESTNVVLSASNIFVCAKHRNREHRNKLSFQSFQERRKRIWLY